MAEETPARYCGNCGHELSPTDQFCRNCGTPVHRAATVPTPEADVSVPPPPQGLQGASEPTDTQKSWLWKWWPFAAVVFVFILLAASVGGNSGGSGSGSVGGNGGGGGGKLAEKPKQEQSATELADLFANGQFYTFLQKENKDGDQLILGVLAGSESDSQIDKIAREIDYDKSRYDVVTVGVLTKDDVTQKQIEEMTKEDESVTGLSNEDFNQQGILVISNSKAAESAFGAAPGEHTYFTSYKAMQQAVSESAAERAAEKGPEQAEEPQAEKKPKPKSEYSVGQ